MRLEKVPSNGEVAEPIPDEKAETLAEQNSHVIEAQVEARPLAKAQEKIDEAEDVEPASAKEELDTELKPEDTLSVASTSDTSAIPRHHHHKKALLKNDDHELSRVQKV
jgi:RNA polymerase II subunit A-like phosphatase